MLSKSKRETSHRRYMRNGTLAGHLILMSVILLCLATFLVLKQLYEIRTWSLPLEILKLLRGKNLPSALTGTK